MSSGPQTPAPAPASPAPPKPNRASTPAAPSDGRIINPMNWYRWIRFGRDFNAHRATAVGQLAELQADLRNLNALEARIRGASTTNPANKEKTTRRALREQEANALRTEIDKLQVLFDGNRRAIETDRIQPDPARRTAVAQWWRANGRKYAECRDALVRNLRDIGTNWGSAPLTAEIQTLIAHLENAISDDPNDVLPGALLEADHPAASPHPSVQTTLGELQAFNGTLRGELPAGPEDGDPAILSEDLAAISTETFWREVPAVAGHVRPNELALTLLGKIGTTLRDNAAEIIKDLRALVVSMQSYLNEYERRPEGFALNACRVRIERQLKWTKVLLAGVLAIGIPTTGYVGVKSIFGGGGNSGAPTAPANPGASGGGSASGGSSGTSAAPITPPASPVAPVAPAPAVSENQAAQNALNTFTASVVPGQRRVQLTLPNLPSGWETFLYMKEATSNDWVLVQTGAVADVPETLSPSGMPDIVVRPVGQKPGMPAMWGPEITVRVPAR